MAGVGKLGWLVLLLMLGVPPAARLSQSAVYGRRFTLPGWLMNVCHHRPASRGTQRHSPRHHNQQLNAVVEQESRGESACTTAVSAAITAGAVAVPAFICRFAGNDQPAHVSDPAFLCTFLI